MNNVLVINETQERSTSLRTKREINFVLSENEGVVEDIVSADYVLIMGDRSIPRWVAQIHCFHVSPGAYSKSLTIQLGKIASLHEGWAKVHSLIQNHTLRHAHTKLLDVDALFEAGQLITADEGETASPLTAPEAATRLAWTYGVQVEQVKISIQL